MTGYSTGDGNQLPSDGTWNYSYDAEGNLTKKVNIASGATWTYGYDHRNQLTWAEERVTDGGTLEMRADYTYDVFGNRIEKQVDQDGDGAVDLTQRYAYDGFNPAKGGAIGSEHWDVWAELDDSGSLTTRYLRGDVVDEVFARLESDGDAYWLLGDSLGSVRDVIDNTGALKDHIAYDGYGNITTETDPVYGGRYKYTGREFDVETQLQYNHARYYDASTGRWISQDPLGFDAGDSNLYRYVNNQPTMATDPSGLQDPNAQYLRQLVDEYQNPVKRDLRMAAGIAASGEAELELAKQLYLQYMATRAKPYFTACTRCHIIHGNGTGIRPWWVDDFGNTNPLVEPALIRWKGETQLELIRMLPGLGGLVQIGEGIAGQTAFGTELDPLSRGMRVASGTLNLVTTSMAVKGALCKAPQRTPSITNLERPNVNVPNRQMNLWRGQNNPLGHGDPLGAGSTGGAISVTAAPDINNAQMTRVFTVTSRPVDLSRAGTGLRTTEGRLNATGAGGTFVVEENFTVGSTQGLAGLPQNSMSALEAHIARYPTTGTTFRYVTEIDLPTNRLQLDPTAPNPATSASRWVAPNTEGARVVRHWRIVEVEDPRGFTRPVLEGPFDGPPPAN